MLQFGLFTSHIPYLIALLIYVTYFGMQSYQKIHDKHNINDNKNIVKLEKKQSTPAKTYFYANYFASIHTDIIVNIQFRSSKYYRQKIPSYFGEIKNITFSRPPPEII